jgi:hypothetical protein
MTTTDRAVLYSKDAWRCYAISNGLTVSEFSRLWSQFDANRIECNAQMVWARLQVIFARATR